MIFSPLDHRPNRSHHGIDRESREIFQQLPRAPNQPQGPRDNNLPGINAINDTLAGAMNLIGGLFNRGDVNAETTRGELGNPRRWVEAFQQADIFTQSQTIRESLRGTAFGPKELLQTMSPAERAAQFWTFVRDVLPPGRVALIPPGAGIPNDTVKDIALGTVALVLGLRPVDSETRPDVLRHAQEAFRELYPEAQFGHIYEDYRELIRQLRAIPGLTGPITPEQYSSRQQLLKIAEENASRLHPGRYLRFVGWMRVNSLDATASAVADKRVAALGAQLRTDELAGTQVNLKSQQLLEKLQMGPKLDAERRNRSFMQNFERLEPWQQYAVIGLGLFAAYKLWNKPGRFLGIIPYWTIPTGVVGTYLYLRLMRGDHDAINTMTGTVQGGINRATDWLSTNIFNRGILPPTVEQEDAARMSVMSRFLNQRAFLSHFPAAAPMMTVAEIKMRHFAGNAFRAELIPGDRIKYSLYAEPRDALYIEAQGIIKRRRYDRNTLHRIFFEHNAEIAQGVGTVFYHLAARRPENRERVKRIEDARRSASVVTPAGTSSMSYDNIRDVAVKRDFLAMINEGRVIALQDHPDMNLIDLIQTFVAEPTRAPERPDNADRVTPVNMNRPRQRDVLAIREQPLLPDRTASIETIRKEFNEWLDVHSSDRFPVLQRVPRSAPEKLRQYAEALFATNRPLPEILHALERIKYVCLITAAHRGGANPVSDTDVETMLGRLPGAADEPGFIPRIVSSIGNWLNRNVLAIASDFQNVNDLQNVETLLQQRLFAGVESGAGRLGALRKQIGEHRTRFVGLRNSTQTAERFANSLDAATIARLGGRPQALAFFQRLTGSGNPRYLEFINAAEQYYAQRVMNEIVTAHIGTHRRDGNHTLDLQPPDRFISPQEEQNLITNNTFIMEQIIGSDVRPLNGMFAAMGMRQLVADMQAATLDMRVDGNRTQAVERVRQLAQLYLVLQPLSARATSLPGLILPPPIGGLPLPPIDLLDIGPRERVRTIARAFIEEWNRLASADPHELFRTESFKSGMEELVNTMVLLEMNSTPSDKALMRQLLEVVRDHFTRYEPVENTREARMLLSARAAARETHGAADPLTQALQKIPILRPR